MHCYCLLASWIPEALEPGKPLDFRGLEKEGGRGVYRIEMHD
jgi:hypothetical protein